MEIRFLGTAASEGWPGIFCQCDSCRRAYKLGGKDVRTRTSLLINGEYMVDLTPDVYLHKLKYGLDLADVRHLFVTHAHYDHFCPDHFKMRKRPFAHMEGERTLHIYGSEDVGRELSRAIGDPEGYQIAYHLVNPFEDFTAGEISATAIAADHDRSLTCLNYVLQLEGKTLLIGFDTGFYPEVTMAFLERFTFDVAIFDCTNGPLEGRRGHMGIPALIDLKLELFKRGVLREGSKVIATHFSHNGGLTHRELERRLVPEGVEVAYDGLVLKI